MLRDHARINGGERLDPRPVDIDGAAVNSDKTVLNEKLPVAEDSPLAETRPLRDEIDRRTEP